MPTPNVTAETRIADAEWITGLRGDFEDSDDENQSGAAIDRLAKLSRGAVAVLEVLAERDASDTLKAGKARADARHAADERLLTAVRAMIAALEGT